MLDSPLGSMIVINLRSERGELLLEIVLFVFLNRGNRCVVPAVESIECADF